MLVVCTFLWGSKYDPAYVERLAAGVRRNLKQPHRFLCMTERERNATFSDGVERHAVKDPHLIGRGCFPRLRLWDGGWQKNRGIGDGDRVASVDLDNVVVGPLDALFERPEDFVILQGVNASNPNPYNASMFMLRPGTNMHVWQDFSPEAAAKVPHDSFPDDQAWLAEMVPGAGAWGPKDGVYAFAKPGWPKGENLPTNARVVCFPGHRDPAKFTRLGWVRDNWGGPIQQERAA
jgi:hypothetical protein